MQALRRTSYHNIICGKIVSYIREEIGTESLLRYPDVDIKITSSYPEELEEFFYKGLTECDEKINTRYALTTIELICRELMQHFDCNEGIIDKINYRLREAKIGWTFDYNAKLLIKVDNAATYQLAVKPAFYLLTNAKFQESADNFSKAFEYYQQDSSKGLESAVDYAVKSLESTIRNICKVKEYSFDEKATLYPLIQTLIKNKFLPEYQDDFLNALSKIFMLCGSVGNHLTRHGKEEDKAKKLQLI
jgi:hypothetical protein